MEEYCLMFLELHILFLNSQFNGAYTWHIETKWSANIFMHLVFLHNIFKAMIMYKTLAQHDVAIILDAFEVLSRLLSQANIKRMWST